MTIHPYFRRTLLERRDGFQFSAAPPEDILGPRFLASNDSTEVLASVLAHARHGDFDKTSLVIDVMHRDRTADTWNSAVNLLAYAGPYSTIRRLCDSFSDELSGKPDQAVQIYLCRILCGAKALWSVPLMLRLLLEGADRSRSDVIAIYLSYLLEAERDRIADGPLLVQPAPANEGPLDFLEPEALPAYDDAAFEALVLTRYDDLTSRAVEVGLDPTRTAVFEADILSLREVLERLQRRVASGIDSEEVETGRMILEGFTGTDCTRFYGEAGSLRPLAAAAIIEEVLESGEVDEYQPGLRYFFRHRVPD